MNLELVEQAFAASRSALGAILGKTCFDTPTQIALYKKKCDTVEVINQIHNRGGWSKVRPSLLTCALSPAT